VRWQDTLALFNVNIWHKLRKENVVPDALSRKHQLKVVYVGETIVQKEVRLGNSRDKFAKEMKLNIQKGIKSHFHLRNGLLWYKQNRLYVLKGRYKLTNLFIHADTKHELKKLHNWQIYGSTTPTDNDFMLWLVKGYIAQENGVKINWVKATAFIAKEKVRRRMWGSLKVEV
jgi:hypothetical protein